MEPETAPQAGPLKLSKPELREAQERSAATVRVVYEAVRQEGEEELKRSSSALAWSGLAAGLSMGFSLMMEGVLRHNLPDANWGVLLSKFGYSAGFVIVILGRQQLFTERRFCRCCGAATWMISACGFTHVVAGSVECFLLASHGLAPWHAVIGGYIVPTLIGNIIGGVSLVAALSHAQVVS